MQQHADPSRRRVEHLQQPGARNVVPLDIGHETPPRVVTDPCMAVYSIF
jgi:hypothetical protein